MLFSPKSLLRHPKCLSTLEDFSNSSFHEVIDTLNVGISSITKVVFLTGKIYYDLEKKKEDLKNTDTVLVRLEQLYPFPKKEKYKLL